MSPRLSTRFGFALPVLSIAALLAGCGAPDLEVATVTQLTTPPRGAIAGGNGLELFEGTGVAVRIAAYTEDPGPAADNSETCDGNCAGRPEPVDPATMDVVTDGGAIDVFRVDDGVYILVGMSPGASALYVSSDEADGVLEIPVTVVPQ